MFMDDMKPGMRVTYIAPENSDYRWDGTVGQIIATGQKIVRFDDGKVFVLNEDAAANFELTADVEPKVLH